MFDLECNATEEDIFVHNIKKLQKVNKQIAKLLLAKEELTNVLIKGFDHSHEGQKTYEYSEWKIEVKTPFVYSLDKKKYESMPFKLPKKFNPIKESISYSIDKRLCDEYLQSAPDEIREQLIDLIDKKPGKASITIKERV